MAECNYNHEWAFVNDEQPECLLITCPEPPLIENGNFETKIYSFGHFVKYECLEGYEKSQNGSPLECSGNSQESQNVNIKIFTFKLQCL